MAQIYDYDIVLESGKHITQDGGTVANSASLAPAYDSTATYAVGDLCTHLGSLYSCSTAIDTAEEWDATHWTEVTVSGQLDNVIGWDGVIQGSTKNAYHAILASEMQKILNKMKELGPNSTAIFKMNGVNERTGLIIAHRESSTVGYMYLIIPDRALNGLICYAFRKFNVNETASDYTPSPYYSFTPVYTNDTSSAWNTTPTAGSTYPVTSGGIYTAIRNATNALSTKLAPVYSASSTYEVGDLCCAPSQSGMNPRAIYVCTTAITVAEAWDASHWAETTIAEHLGGGSAPMVEITWAELKALRDAGTLVPGMQYRITDYQCTTTTANTSSANHQFDIIVTADDESHLSEVARAALHSGDTYFANCKMNAWQLWYCLDNDTNRFAWADTTNGKGVIFRMIDEWDNDVPYDFKNIRFTLSGKYTNAYTFHRNGNDASLENSSHTYGKTCYSNTIKPYLGHVYGENNYMTQILNQNVFYDTVSNFNVYDNVLGPNCYNNTFARATYGNYFGEGCYNNSFADALRRNVFVGYNYNITGGSYIENNIFRADVSSLTTGMYLQDSDIGGNRITLGEFCSRIMIAPGSWSIVIPNKCQDIRIDGYKLITLTSSDQESVGYIKNVHIHAGVEGTNDSIKTITVSRNLPYSTDIYAIGSVRDEI